MALTDDELLGTFEEHFLAIESDDDRAPVLDGLREIEREATYWALFEASQFIYDELLGAPIEVRIKARALLRTEAAKHERLDSDR